jgi:hypothetical protein
MPRPAKPMKQNSKIGNMPRTKIGNSGSNSNLSDRFRIGRSIRTASLGLPRIVVPAFTGNKPEARYWRQMSARLARSALQATGRCNRRRPLGFAQERQFVCTKRKSILGRTSIDEVATGSGSPVLQTQPSAGLAGHITPVTPSP